MTKFYIKGQITWSKKAEMFPSYFIFITIEVPMSQEYVVLGLLTLYSQGLIRKYTL